MFVTLMYHLIDGSIRASTAISEKAFDEQISLLRNIGYQFLSLSQAQEIVAGKIEAPPQGILITFDDGYADNITAALPVLMRYGVPAALFVISAYVGQSNRWNPKACYDSDHASWDELRIWLNGGCEIGGHSHDHLCMTRLNENEIRHSVQLNKDLLEDKLGIELTAFSYPYGLYNAAIRQIVSESFQLAFSDTAGSWVPWNDRYAINRLGVRPEWSIKEFQKRIDALGYLSKGALQAY
ncbi:MAG: polysaccharide deacetylase family protein [Candidatus Promineifilaceae bacterium]|nr:polysaccharide deacetylase family protein [Candidatus Promineifilaceae bacterium]